MEKDQQAWEKIEGYLLNQLDPSEKELFEAELRINVDLARETAVYRELISEIEATARDEMMDFLDSQDDASEKRPPFTILGGLGIILTIAATALMLLFSFPSPESQLVQEFFTLDPGIPSTLGTGPTEQLAKALGHYRKKNYDEASSLMDDLWEEGVRSDTLAFFYGQLKLQSKDWEGAALALNLVVANPKSTFQERAEWYQGLAWLGEKQNSKAKLRFEIISSQEQHFFKQEAMEILAKWP